MSLDEIVEGYDDRSQGDSVIGSKAPPFQVFAPLDGPTEDALRASIRRFGVIVPIVVDQRGRIIDGHHRERLARELGVRCEQIVRRVRNDDEAKELARTLNEDRRQLDPETRRLVVADLREQGHSHRAIAGALGVSHEQVRQDAAISPVNELTREITGRDGKAYGKPPELKRCSTCRDEKPLGSEVLGRTLRIIRDSYGDPGLEALVINGIGHIVGRFDDQLDGELRQRLLATRPVAWVPCPWSPLVGTWWLWAGTRPSPATALRRPVAGCPAPPPTRGAGHLRRHAGFPVPSPCRPVGAPARPPQRVGAQLGHRSGARAHGPFAWPPVRAPLGCPGPSLLEPHAARPPTPTAASGAPVFDLT